MVIEKNVVAHRARLTNFAMMPQKFLCFTPVFFVVYCIFCVPTYILPYVGPNSALVNIAMADAAETGALPAHWWHLFFLVALGVIAWVRGQLIGKEWLVVFPALAGIFDMTPGLNWIPLAPTGFHVATLIVGVKHPVPVDWNGRHYADRTLLATAILIFALVTALYKHVTYENPWDRDARLAAENSANNKDRETVDTNYAPVTDNTQFDAASAAQTGNDKVAIRPDLNCGNFYLDGLDFVIVPKHTDNNKMITYTARSDKSFVIDLTRLNLTANPNDNEVWYDLDQSQEIAWRKGVSRPAKEFVSAWQPCLDEDGRSFVKITPNAAEFPETGELKMVFYDADT